LEFVASVNTDETGIAIEVGQERFAVRVRRNVVHDISIPSVYFNDNIFTIDCRKGLLRPSRKRGNWRNVQYYRVTAFITPSQCYLYLSKVVICPRDDFELDIRDTSGSNGMPK